MWIAVAGKHSQDGVRRKAFAGQRKAVSAPTLPCERRPSVPDLACERFLAPAFLRMLSCEGRPSVLYLAEPPGTRPDRASSGCQCRPASLNSRGATRSGTLIAARSRCGSSSSDQKSATRQSQLVRILADGGAQMRPGSRKCRADSAELWSSASRRRISYGQTARIDVRRTAKRSLNAAMLAS